MTSARTLLVILVTLPMAARAPVSARVDPTVAVVTSDNSQGNCDAIEIDPPWMISRNLESVGLQARVRYFYDRLYVINPSRDDIQVIDPASFDTVRTLRMDRGSSPEDILVVSPDRAYVTLYDNARLAIIDPRNGAPRGSVDLSPFADADGLPEMSMMARDGERLFIQIQRLDRLSNNPVRPSSLAVVDLDTEMLVDVDPDTPGLQGIRLNGTIPSFRMHVESRARRLFVSTPGPRLDTSGGIEEIDLDALRSLGFILSEEDVSADVGGFVMITADAGYALSHTDIVASSHLFPFSRTQGQGSEILLTFGFIETLAYDRPTSQLFFPDPFSMRFGVHVIDTLTNRVVTGPPIATGLPPWDLAVVRPTTPGEVRDLVVLGVDPLTGGVSLAYRPACGASNHSIVFGPLEEVRTYGYSGRICDVGTTGTAAFDPGPSSFFFLMVGTADSGSTGTYGADSGLDERPAMTADPGCPFTQDLGFPCDR